MTTTDDVAEVEQHIRDYIERWSAKDAAAVWTRYYRLDASQRMKSQADVQAVFDELAADGFARTEMHSVTASLDGPDRATAKIRFTRWRTDGTSMPPENRGAVYALRRFPDGWRITAVGMAD